MARPTTKPSRPRSTSPEASGKTTAIVPTSKALARRPKAAKVLRAASAAKKSKPTARSASKPATPRAASARKAPASRRVLRGLSDIRRYFYRNPEPFYFISATNFNLMNTDEWARNFKFINYVDCFDGRHPNVFVPKQRTDRVFQSLEEIVNWLLEHKETRDYIERRGPGGKAVFLFFDDRTEELCKELGLTVCFPPASLRRFIDDKVNTTRLGNEAGVASVPNVLARIDSYQALRRASRRLGDELVVQTSFGDSGQTTFFIKNEDDYRKHAHKIEHEPQVKIMKRIRCRQAALEACVTRHGTIVGPLMTELVGFPQLTPYKGGWCGNEVFHAAFSVKQRQEARKSAFRFGERIRELGYKGYFELDFLIDMDSDKVYLGEVNPRITGASSMTNLAAFAHSDAPLFLFHLLEWCDVEWELDVEELNRRWDDPANIDTWSQLIMKQPREGLAQVVSAPPTGVWKLRPDRTCEFVRVQTHRRTVEDETQAFFLRICGPGDYMYKGADVGILLAPGRFMDEDYRLTERARMWIDAIHSQYGLVPVQPESLPPAPEPAEVGSLKML